MAARSPGPAPRCGPGVPRMPGVRYVPCPRCPPPSWRPPVSPASLQPLWPRYPGACRCSPVCCVPHALPVHLPMSPEYPPLSLRAPPPRHPCFPVLPMILAPCHGVPLLPGVPPSPVPPKSPLRSQGSALSCPEEPPHIIAGRPGVGSSKLPGVTACAAPAASVGFRGAGTGVPAGLRHPPGTYTHTHPANCTPGLRAQPAAPHSHGARGGHGHSAHTPSACNPPHAHTHGAHQQPATPPHVHTRDTVCKFVRAAPRAACKPRNPHTQPPHTHTNTVCSTPPACKHTHTPGTQTPSARHSPQTCAHTHPQSPQTPKLAHAHAQSLQTGCKPTHHGGTHSLQPHKLIHTRVCTHPPCKHSLHPPANTPLEQTQPARRAAHRHGAHPLRPAQAVPLRGVTHPQHPRGSHTQSQAAACNPCSPQALLQPANSLFPIPLQSTRTAVGTHTHTQHPCATLAPPEKVCHPFPQSRGTRCMVAWWVPIPPALRQHTKAPGATPRAVLRWNIPLESLPCCLHRCSRPEGM